MSDDSRPFISRAGREHLRLALTDGVGPRIFGRLIDQFGAIDAALGASHALLAANVRGVSDKIAAAILRGPAPGVLDAELDACERGGVRIMCRADDDYPPGLRHIPDAPIVLYLRGELRPTDAVAVAVVGSRRCSIYGSEQARRFGELLAGAGFTVVSGLARGIDAFAHHGAVDAGGRSIAVMGAGLSEVYPPENRPLAEKLLGSGAWLSELPMTAAVRASNFPGRNRIIAGMTLGTIVVEAAARSGALITARLASEYNREVFAVPGRVQDPMSLGTNALIRDSAAKLVTCLEDVLAELGDVGATLRTSPPVVLATDGAAPDDTRETRADDVARTGDEGGRSRPVRRAKAKSAAASALAPPLLTAVESAVLALVGAEGVGQDALLAGAGFPPGEVLAAITSLELKGQVRRQAGNRVAPLASRR